ncbi:MAG: penicillin acylase family protein [Lentisphaeria bacterium]|nr:penicillin acylase family protein [Candidatus Neomarinimicrobiota bacterium]MCF7842831.1 penicillin acylase family protein [Lentisphaeria bacterium]
MSRAKKVSFWILGILIVLVLLGWGYVHNLATRGLPDYDGELQLSGLQQPVTVYRDDQAIPHIYAANEVDLYRAVGYTMAQDRLWQMDLIRRATQGRLSEIFGIDMWKTDRLMRSLRISEKSAMVWDSTSTQIKAVTQAFAAGVNAYIESRGKNLPPEFVILGYKPDPWEPQHSFNLIGYMAWDLTMPWSTEIILAKLTEKLGTEMVQELVPNIPEYTSVVYDGYHLDLTETRIQSEMWDAAKPLEALGIEVFQGSNNWVVSGEKSVTGKPILANDMHLGLFAPGIWYQMHTCIPGELNVTGVALAGAPFVIAGHNDSIAWGLTNVMVDDMDFYLEKINPDNPNQYEFNGNWRDMEVREEVILGSDGEERTVTLQFTHRGPVISDFKGLPDRSVSMRWIGNEYSNEVRSVYMLNRAKNWDDFKNAVRTFISVSQNVAYADVAGNIGIYCSAGIPIRNGNGIGIQPGWTAEYDWQRLVPFEEQPHVYNPPEGFVSSANNKSVTDDYPYYISHWYDLPHRIDRIREMLRDKEKLSIADIKAIQADRKSKLVEQYRPRVLESLENMQGLTATEENALAALSEWRGNLDPELAAPAIWEQTYLALVKVIFRDEMGDSLYLDYIDQRLLPKYGIDQLFRNNGSAWCDDVNTPDVTETFDDMLQKAFRNAVAQLSNMRGPTVNGWRWGDIHQLTLNHPMGSVSLLDKVFNLNRGPWPVGGSNHTVGPYSYNFANPYAVTDGASHRHIFSTANWDASQTVIPTGVSGIPASPYYCDQTDDYVNNVYHDDFVSENLVIQHARYTLKLTP